MTKSVRLFLVMWVILGLVYLVHAFITYSNVKSELESAVIGDINSGTIIINHIDNDRTQFYLTRNNDVTCFLVFRKHLILPIYKLAYCYDVAAAVESWGTLVIDGKKSCSMSVNDGVSYYYVMFNSEDINIRFEETHIVDDILPYAFWFPIYFIVLTVTELDRRHRNDELKANIGSGVKTSL